MNQVQEYEKSLAMGYLVIASTIALLLQSIYREYVETVLKLMFTEEYSYLLVSFTTVTLVLYLSLNYMGFTHEVQLSKLLASAFLTVTSIALYQVSKLTLEYSIHILGLSFASATMSIMMLVFKPATIGDAALILTPLLTVPIPTGVIDVVTTRISRTIGMIAAVLTNTKFIDVGAFTTIHVETNQGVYVFIVEAACSGVLMISAVIAVLPLLAYYAAVSSEKVLKKLKASLLALLIGLLIGFIGNLVKLLLIIVTAKYYSVDAAMSVFQCSPSIVYASISAFLAHTLINRLMQVKPIAPRSLEASTSTPGLKWRYVSGVLVLSVAIALLMQSLVTATAGTSVMYANSIVVEVNSLDEVVKNPAAHLISSKSRVVELTHDSFLTRISNALAMYRMSVVVDNALYHGYLEIVDTPARLHTLQLCVSLQGFKALNSWSELREMLQLSYIAMEKNTGKYILSYTLLPIKVKTLSNEQVLYARVSILRPYSSATDLESSGKALVAMLNINGEHVVNLENNATYILGITGATLFTVLITYTLTVYAYKYIRSIRRGVKRELIGL